MADTQDPRRPFNSDARPVDQPPQLVQNGIDAFAPLLVHSQAWTRQITQLNTSIQREWLSFVDKRLKEEAAFSQSLIGCKALDDVMRTYTAFYRTAFDDYQKEFSTLTKLGTSITTEAIETASATSTMPDGRMPAASSAAARQGTARGRDTTSPASSH
jgi:Phasin protein